MFYQPLLFIIKLNSLYTFHTILYNKIVLINTSHKMKVGDYMPNGLEITKAALDDFKKIQEYMIVAKEENATRTYAKLKKEYLTLKALLNVSGVNLTDIDDIKE